MIVKDSSVTLQDKDGNQYQLIDGVLRKRYRFASGWTSLYDGWTRNKKRG